MPTKTRVASTGQKATKVLEREISYTMESDPSEIMGSIEEDPSEDPYEPSIRVVSTTPAVDRVRGVPTLPRPLVSQPVDQGMMEVVHGLAQPGFPQAQNYIKVFEDTSSSEVLNSPQSWESVNQGSSVYVMGYVEEQDSSRANKRKFPGKPVLEWKDNTASPREDDHAGHLRMVLRVLQERKLFAKFSKCEFWLNPVNFLGHIISEEGIQVDTQEIEAVKTLPRPTTPMKVHSFSIWQDITGNL
ncbi:uncharacterized protein [Nicotiana sylvestris]|uniref:uncharacterized protein n=1 Tax=Nicotiana sylvestris TaxID=4096 RepID=UPI00388CA23F